MVLFINTLIFLFFMVTKNIKILIAEDDQPLAKALKLKLERAGFEVEAVSDGEEALAAIAKNGFSLVFLDIMMPRKDGFAVLAEMKAKKIKIPVVVLSNLGQEGDLKKATELGAVGYFIKSDTPIAEVVSRAKKILGV